MQIDLDLLASDLQFWKSVHMQNEIRELAASLQNLLNRRRRKTIKDMLFLVKANCEGFAQDSKGCLGRVKS